MYSKKVGGSPKVCKTYMSDNSKTVRRTRSRYGGRHFSGCFTMFLIVMMCLIAFFPICAASFGHSSPVNRPWDLGDILPREISYFDVSYGRHRAATGRAASRKDILDRALALS